MNFLFKVTVLFLVVCCCLNQVFAGNPMALDAARASSNLPAENAGRTQQQQAQKMKNDQNEEQNKSYSEKCNVDLPELTSAYTFMNAEYFQKADQSEYNAPQKTKEAAVDFVKKTYFYDSKEPITPELEAEIVQKRQKYNQEFQEKVRFLAAGVLEKLQEDKQKATDMSAETCGILEDLSVDSKVVQALVRQTIAEIGFQIALLERTIIDTLQTEPVSILDKPDSESESEKNPEVAPTVPTPKAAPTKPKGSVLIPGSLAVVR